MNKDDFEVSVKEASNLYKIINNQFIKIVMYLYDHELLNDDYLMQYQECCEISNDPKAFIKLVEEQPNDAQKGNTYEVDYVLTQYKRDNMDRQRMSE